MTEKKLTKGVSVGRQFISVRLEVNIEKIGIWLYSQESKLLVDMCIKGEGGVEPFHLMGHFWVVITNKC